VSNKLAFRKLAWLAIATTITITAFSAVPSVHAATFAFNTDPFAGSNALITPGRQVVGDEISIPAFEFANDVLAFDAGVFDIPAGIDFFNGLASAIPLSGANFIVLRTFDGDGNPLNGNQLNAGSAADLIVDRITGAGAGFFVYFNSGLDLPRLVYSTDLDSNQADLKVLARFTGLTGASGRDAMAEFSAYNVASVPEPESWAMMIAGFGLVGAAARRQRTLLATA
jgi:hypothetical protein